MWKAIQGTNGMIEVSEEGQIRSLLRGEPRILKTQTDNKGYQRVRVTINRQKKAVLGFYRGTDSCCFKRFESVREAETYIGSRHISDVLKGKRSHAKGWTFRYEEVMPNED